MYDMNVLIYVQNTKGHITGCMHKCMHILVQISSRDHQVGFDCSCQKGQCWSKLVKTAIGVGLPDTPTHYKTQLDCQHTKCNYICHSHHL